MKVRFFDRRVFGIFLKVSSGISTGLSTALLFIDIPQKYKIWAFIAFLLTLLVIYATIWKISNSLKSVNIKIEGTNVSVKAGDIFEQPGFKAIAFNEYFDTLVDDRLISRASLNGIFIESHLDTSVEKLDQEISSFPFDEDEVLGVNSDRTSGKKQKYRLGTIFVHGDYLLAAMSKFDSSNRATLTMPEYLEFLIQFWDGVNRVYAQKSVSTPIFGSGITRIKGHKDIGDEDLLKIMLWTFRVSEMRFKYPAKLSIIIHREKIDQINLLDIKSLKNGV